MKVVLDIETIQCTREDWLRLGGKCPPVEDKSPPFDLFAAGEAEAERQAENEQYAKAAFDGTYSSIVCIGLLEFSDQMEPRGAVAWYGGNERELLRQFWSRLAQNKPSLSENAQSSIRSSPVWILIWPSFEWNRCMTRWRSGAIGTLVDGSNSTSWLEH